MLDDSSAELHEASSLHRLTSVGFYSLKSYEPIVTIAELIKFADKNGNTAAHHAASIGLPLTVAALFKAGASRWVANKTSDTPAGILDGIPLFAGSDIARLHKALMKHGLLPAEALAYALKTPADYRSPAMYDQLIESICGNSDDDEDNAAYLAAEAVRNKIPHAKLYRALVYLLKGYGTLMAKNDIEHYLAEVLAGEHGKILDPLYYFARFLIWKTTLSNGKPSHAKKDKLLASGKFYIRIASYPTIILVRINYTLLRLL